MRAATALIYITDNSGRKMWNTLCSADYVAPERRNLERHLANAAKNPEAYHFLDLESARIVCEGERKLAADDDALLAELGF